MAVVCAVPYLLDYTEDLMRSRRRPHSIFYNDGQPKPQRRLPPAAQGLTYATSFSSARDAHAYYPRKPVGCNVQECVRTQEPGCVARYWVPHRPTFDCSVSAFSQRHSEHQRAQKC